MLTFPDATRIAVNGLDETLAELYSEGRPTTPESADEIIRRLEARKNFIPSSDRIRKEYAFMLLKEYKTYVAGKERNVP